MSSASRADYEAMPRIQCIPQFHRDDDYIYLPQENGDPHGMCIRVSLASLRSINDTLPTKPPII